MQIGKIVKRKHTQEFSRKKIKSDKSASLAPSNVLVERGAVFNHVFVY